MGQTNTLWILVKIGEGMVIKFSSADIFIKFCQFFRSLILPHFEFYCLTQEFQNLKQNGLIAMKNRKTWKMPYSARDKM